ncbi:MAG TPA: TIGR02147 family protein [Bdellovibrionota bacterium]|nr:TIGR02147 family protein [Bdellovibrionota bacterium]
MRATAKALGVSAGALSETLRGLRPLTWKSALRMSPIFVTPERRVLWARAVPDAPAPPEGSRSPSYVKLDPDQAAIVSDWYYFAILSLAETRDFQDSPRWIAERLGIDVLTARAALERLERLRLLARDASGKLRPGLEYYSAPTEGEFPPVRRCHVQNLEHARKSLELDPIALRDFTSITVATDPARILEAKRRIRRFRRQLSRYLQGGRKLEVYELCFYVFPLSRRSRRA